ncbi:nuclease EXOG, mitochondrial isoform X2 [Ahaetulla prasina]|uniref:nuclease EXOG, mitochondrial isoform X2 n=1 Tax=Ahaetulla prasina TaxID=499056 RepID=UPI002647ED2A|nr:nuclease EXOG, mitochondrial isoform X2 [Ahaetulla prasina]
MEEQLSRAPLLPLSSPPHARQSGESAQSGQGGGEKPRSSLDGLPDGASMAEAIGARLVRNRFFGGFVCGAALGATISGLLSKNLLTKPDWPPSTAAPQPEQPLPSTPPPLGEPGPKSILERYGFPAAGTQIRYYTNHALSYDQAKRVPRWVIEHISKYKTSGNADRKHYKFKADPNIPFMFSAVNEDYIGSGWSRGHMAPAGDNKHSPVIGKDEVAVPSHLYKVILARRSEVFQDPLLLGAFVVPNRPIGFDHQLQEFQVGIEDLEKMSGLVFFPEVNKSEDVRNICEVDSCKLMTLEEFTLYITTRKLQNARTPEKLGKIMSELREKGIEPDEYLLKVYNKKKEELAEQTAAEVRERKVG